MHSLLKIPYCKRTPAVAAMLMGVCVAVMSCYNDKEEILYPGNNAATDCATVPAKFSTDVYPLINSKCAIPGCHDASASGGVIMQNYNQINAKKDRINVRAVIEKSMPPTGPLAPADANKIKCWIEGGALNN